MKTYKRLLGVRNEPEAPLQFVILQQYVAYLGDMSKQQLPQILLREASDWSTMESCAQELKKYVFRVRRLKHHGDGIDKYTPVKEFINFLARLLRLSIHVEIELIDRLVKELRFLLTVLGDTSLLVCADEYEEFADLSAEFEGVANEAGSFVHSLLFPTVGERDDSTAVVLNQINLLKSNIMKLLDCVPESTYVSTSVVDSLLVLDTTVGDLDDLKNRDDNPIDDNDDDLKDQIQTIHLGLICLQFFIKDIFLPKPLDQIGELKDYYMRIGDSARQVQYLIISSLAGYAPSWYLFNRLIHVNNKIELCRIELPQMIMKYKSGGLKAANYFNKQLSLRNTATDENLVGSEEKMTYILDHLVGGGAELRVISIFGMPGLGKTTLAKKLYNHPYVKCRFDRLSWCVVSQTYLRRNVLVNILIDIASELGRDVILKMKDNRLVEHIHKTMKGRRYLIVLDDIWDSNVCDDLVGCFPDDGNGSRILFTSRNKEVAPPNCIMYALPSLSNAQCWELLEKKVFGNQRCPPQLVEIGTEVAENCRGMPLAAVVIAGVLSTAGKEERTWAEVRRNMSSYILDGGDNSAMRILKLSYDHLPQHLKLCFLYLGVAFENNEIPARHMMNMWTAEGFITKENKKDTTERYLNELIDKGLVMVAKRRSDGGPKTCLVHDLLRELCLKTCEEEKLTRFVNNKYLKDGEHRLKAGMHSTTWMYDMRLLRVLYFNCSFIYLTGIEYLVCLKYLVVYDLPPSIANLVNLEYLCVSGSYEKVYLSSTIMQMKKLKYVNVYVRARYGEDCRTSLANKLEFLSNVLIRNVKDEKMLKCSPHLRRLKCFYSKRVYCGIDLSFLTRLESLSVGFNKSSLFGGSICLPSSITKLTLDGYLKELCPKTMSTIGRLENLEVLKIKHVKFEGKRWDTRGGEFEKLRYLRFHCTDLARWNVGSSEHFPKLQYLKLHWCPKLGEIPAEIGEIPTMQTIEVDALLEESARRIEQEQRDVGNEDLRVVISTSYKMNGRKLLRAFKAF